MRRFLLAFILLPFSVGGVMATDSLMMNRKLCLEVQIGQVIQPRYWSGAEYRNVTIQEYYFTSGVQYTLALSAPVGKRFSFGTRWKQDIYGSNDEAIAAEFQKQQPHLKFNAIGKRWRMSQLNTGFAVNFDFGNSGMQIGQYAGVTILRVPRLRVIGSPEVLVIRRPQKHVLYSLYTTIRGHHSFTSQRYLFIQGEFAFHRATGQRIELETVFGLPDYYRGRENKYVLNYSLNFGIGWRLGKR